MLCVNNYTKGYIDGCCSRITAQVAAYQALLAAAGNTSAKNESFLNSATELSESLFFSHMLLMMDDYFIHRPG
jgi:hypothetical protein